MGILGRAGAGLSVVGSFVPGIGTGLATIGTVAAVLDAQAPEAILKLPIEWRDPWRRGGPLWGIRSSGYTDYYHRWKIDGRWIRDGLSDIQLARPVGAGPLGVQPAAWTQLKPIPRREKDWPGDGERLARWFGKESRRRGGIGRMIGRRFIIHANSSSFHGSDSFRWRRYNVEDAEGQVLLGANWTVKHFKQLIAKTKRLQETGAHDWRQADLRRWKEDGAWLDYWHDQCPFIGGKPHYGTPESPMSWANWINVEGSWAEEAYGNYLRDTEDNAARADVLFDDLDAMRAGQEAVDRAAVEAARVEVAADEIAQEIALEIQAGTIEPEDAGSVFDASFADFLRGQLSEPLTLTDGPDLERPATIDETNEILAAIIVGAVALVLLGSAMR